MATVTPTNSAGVSEHVHSAEQLLKQFSQAARIYNFQPEVIGHREEKHPKRRDWWAVIIQTPSHAAQVINGRLVSINSLYDGSDTRRKPEAVNEWYKATAKWTKEEAIQETLSILGRLGDATTLNDVAQGSQEFRADLITARTPDGNMVQVAPFPTIWLRDSEGVGRVEAEFRMGPTGVLGITKWFRP